MKASTAGQGLGRLAKWALVLALAVVIVVILMGPGYQLGAVSLGTAFGLVFPWATYAAIGIVVVSLAGLLASLIKRRMRAAAVFGLAAVLCGGLVFQMLELRAAARAVPPIHDVTTDLDNPPGFAVLSPRSEEEETVVPARDESMEALSPAERWLAYHKAAYDDLRTLRLNLPADDAAELAAEAAREMGWEIAAVDPAAGRIEATDTTAWFGFRDDIVIRIVAVDPGVSQVDVRSVSRVGVSDLGVNAARIRSYLDMLTRMADTPR
ncbi:MAG: DUF1499 domain-containing protein [Woeseiaceae bacterium]|nr:DUF1499 domain-containing protein [Woeseiaceae bacterium]